MTARLRVSTHNRPQMRYSTKSVTLLETPRVPRHIELRTGFGGSPLRNMDSETMDMLTAEVVRYVIFKNYQQPGVPIKRRELTTLITEKYKQRALPTQIIEAAKNKLAATFGFELKALDRSLLADPGRQSQGNNRCLSHIRYKACHGPCQYTAPYMCFQSLSFGHCKLYRWR